MVVVGLETSSTNLGVAVVQDQHVRGDTTLHMKAFYAEQLPLILERFLEDLSLSWQQVDGFAISIGPGSYTGLRVGLSLVKGLAYAQNRPIAAVPTLDAVAFQIPFSPHPVHVLTDARRDRVYEARYDTSYGYPKRISPYRISPIEDLLQSIDVPVVLAGTGVTLHQETITKTLGDRACLSPAGADRLMASSIALLGLRSLQAGDHASLYELEPLYLRSPDFVKQT